MPMPDSQIPNAQIPHVFTSIELACERSVLHQGPFHYSFAAQDLESSLAPISTAAPVAPVPLTYMPPPRLYGPSYHTVRTPACSYPKARTCHRVISLLILVLNSTCHTLSASPSFSCLRVPLLSSGLCV